MRPISEIIERDDSPARRSHGVLRLAELHPLIAEVAAEPWERMAYAEAVEAGWYAIRDVLRDKLDSSMDGSKLVNLIAEGGDPRLLLTGFSTETEESMHRGLVYMLRGVASYVRNPMAHDAGPPGGDDPVRCFEYLALMSICARHVVDAVQPTTVEAIVREASQARFSGAPEAVADLVTALPASQRPRLVVELASAYQRAIAAGSDQAEKLLKVYLGALADLGADAQAVRRATRVCAGLLADDRTFDAGLHLLNLSVFRTLAPRYRANVVQALFEDTRAGQMENGRFTSGGEYFGTLIRVFDGFTPEDRAALVRLLAHMMLTASPAVTYAIRVLSRLNFLLRPEEYGNLIPAFGVVATQSELDEEAHREAWRCALFARREFATAAAERLSLALDRAHAAKHGPGTIRRRQPADHILDALQMEGHRDSSAYAE